MIFNDRDTSGFGLFSKVGRQITQKIHILTKNKKNKYQKLSKTNIQTVSDNKEKISSQKKHISKRQPFQKSLPRQQRNKIFETKNSNPSVGQYNISLSTKPLLVWDIMQVYQKVQNNQSSIKLKKQSIQTNCNEDSSLSKKNLDETNDSIKIRNKSRGFVEMSKMTGRDQNPLFAPIKPEQIQLQNSLNLQESRVSTNQKVKNVLRFDQQLSRDRYQNKNISTVLYYDYDINKVKKSLGNGGPKFQKRLGRQYVKQNSISHSMSHYDYDEYFWKRQSQIYRNTKLNIISYDRLKGRQTII